MDDFNHQCLGAIIAGVSKKSATAALPAMDATNLVVSASSQTPLEGRETRKTPGRRD
jgi:hypothetical protein